MGELMARAIGASGEARLVLAPSANEIFAIMPKAWI
jgi:hypothetical protein